MPKEFKCRDIGMNCSFSAKAESEKELFEKVAEHAKSAHNMSKIEPATEKKIKAAIKNSR